MLIRKAGIEDIHQLNSEDKKIDGKRIFIFELEGSLTDKEENLKNIQSIEGLIGKRVFNFNESGYIKLGIE